jgi:hypothetical protein
MEPSKARSVQLEAADTEITGEEIPARGERARASEQHLQPGGSASMRACRARKRSIAMAWMQSGADTIQLCKTD